ncbi:MAG: peptidylprolyl isomerase [Bryobacteraceae bacterium]
MFDLFRSRTNSVRYLLMALLSLVALSMVITLIPGFGSPGMESTDQVLAEVAGEPVTARMVSQVVQQQMRNQQMSMQAMEMMLPQVVNKIVGEMATAYQAKQMGFSVSNDEVVSEIKTLMPQLFQGGEFVGKEAYQAYLSQMNLSIGEFEGKVRQQVLLDKLQRLAFDGIIVAPAEVESEYQKRNEKSRLEVIKVDAAELRGQFKPTREEMLDHLRKNQAGYQVPPTRTVGLLIADADKMGESLKITDAELKAAYDGQISRFRVDERVNVRHILIKAEGTASKEEKAKAKAKAEDLLKQLRAGANFADLAKKNSEDPGSAQKGGDLDWITRGQTVKPFEDAAFSLKPNELSGVVESLFGYHIIQPLKKEASHTKPFDEVRGELLSEMRKRQLFDKMPAIVDQARAELVKAPDQAAQIAAKFNLTYVRGEKLKPSDAFPVIGDNRQLAMQVMPLQKGGVSEPVQTSDNKLAIAVVEEVFPERPAQLADVEDLVRAAIVEEKARELADSRIKSIEAKLKSSPDDLRAAAAAAGVKIVDTGLFARGGQMKDVGPQAYFGEQAFVNPTGKVVGPYTIGSARYFFRIVEKEKGSTSGLETERTNIVNSIKDRKLSERRDLFEEGLLEKLKASGKVKINDDAVKRMASTYRTTGA